MVDIVASKGKPDWSAQLHALEPLFDGAHPDSSWTSRDIVHRTAQKTAGFLEADIQSLEAEAGFIFSLSESDDLTQHIVDMLRSWHIVERPPGLAALSIFAIRNLGLDMPPEIVKSLLAASVLGEVENDLPYHNNLHYKKVVLQAMRLIAVHNDIYKSTPQALDGRQAGLILIAACIHDLGHDGKGNTIKGVFEQGRLEKRAFDLASLYLEGCGMNAEDLNAIKVMLLCTDVSPLGEETNPVNQMKATYRYHFLGQQKKTGPLNLDPKLSILEKDAPLTMMATLLHEADIATSAGLDYTVTIYETGIYKQELGAKIAYPSDIIDFLKDICQRQMLSDAAQRLYAGNMARIYALAEKEIAAGNPRFPKPEQSVFMVFRSDMGVGGNTTIN